MEPILLPAGGLQLPANGGHGVLQRRQVRGLVRLIHLKLFQQVLQVGKDTVFYQIQLGHGTASPALAE